MDEATIRQIHSKARWGNKEELKKLLTDKAAATATDKGTGNQPIHIAAQNGHLEIAEMILAAGGEVNATNGNGLTALHMSVEYDYYWTSKMLLAKGADQTIVSGEGSKAENGIEGVLRIVCI